MGARQSQTPQPHSPSYSSPLMLVKKKKQPFLYMAWHFYPKIINPKRPYDLIVV